ncbi:hypothetical protein EV715DRAFT_266646 [Schizophyllum commune]
MYALRAVVAALAVLSPVLAQSCYNNQGTCKYTSACKGPMYYSKPAETAKRRRTWMLVDRAAEAAVNMERFKDDEEPRRARPDRRLGEDKFIRDYNYQAQEMMAYTEKSHRHCL